MPNEPRILLTGPVPGLNRKTNAIVAGDRRDERRQVEDVRQNADARRARASSPATTRADDDAAPAPGSRRTTACCAAAVPDLRVLGEQELVVAQADPLRRRQQVERG